MQSLFGVAQIPSDSQLRNLLDPLGPAGLQTPFWEIYAQLQAAGHLDAYTGAGGHPPDLAGQVTILQFGESAVPELPVTIREEQPHYSHGVLLTVVGAPEQAAVICLAPEFITLQDGHDKQDCEQQAIKRWLKRNTVRFAPESGVCQ